MTKYDIAANIAIAGLDSFEGKMTAAQQREVFGKAYFGRKTITIHNENQGSVEVWWSSCFGTDQGWTVKTFAEIAQAVSENRPWISF